MCKNKMFAPLVSVIIPSFNNESRVEFALKSAIAQDYNNLEIIFINDASTDNTPAIAEKILQASERPFTIINHQRNLGVSVARNNGIKISRGDFIVFCDGDDIMKKNLISSLLALIQKYNCEISFGSIVERFESGAPDNPIPMRFNINQPMKGEQAAYMRIFKKGFMPHLCCTMFKKSLIERALLRFTPDCTSGEDLEFQKKAFCLAEKISFTSEILYVYVHHAGMGNIRDNDTRDKKFKRANDLLEADFRTAEFLSAHAKSKKIKFIIENSYLPELAIKRFTICAKFHEAENYSALLKEPKLKKILLRSFRTIFFKPEIFLKALMLLIMPKIYFYLRSYSKNT